jgi:hypothetical protein
MKRLLSLLVGAVAALAVTWGCGPKPVDDDDDSTSGSGGKGGAGGFGASSGSGSATGGSGNTCGAGLTMCSGTCSNLTNDSAHCGSCVTACTVGQACVSSQCSCTAATACPAGQVCNGTVCACPAGQSVCASTGLCSIPTACVAGAGGAGGAGGTAGTGGVSPTGGIGAMGGAISAGGAPPMAGAGGSVAGNAGSGSGTVPAGYWSYDTWHGCAWTGIDTDTTATIRTTVMPQDFTSGHAAGDPYCVKGSVGNTYESVALLGFNLAQPAEGTSCVYDPAAASAMGPPGVALTKTGLAINFSKKTASTLRVQIQGPNGATDPNNRWCYTITDAAGPVFAPYSMFNTECWDGMGTNYDGVSPISAVVFLVPGATAATPYDFCINGFAAGDSADDAPDGGTSGPLMGTIGGPGATDLDFQRVKVKKDGKSYIIQNNNWGNPSGSDQTISYVDNSFKVISTTGNGSSAPASFPSIFIGANGDTQGGTFSTSSDDHLPKQVSAITSLMTTFRHNASGGQLNAAYDVWFSSSIPTARYDDGISGFVMLWLYTPSNFHPIGWNNGTPNRTANIAGKSWQVFVGPRGGSGPNANAPVVNYIANPATTSMVNFDLKPFIADAATNGIQSSWYLTDVFAGFEIWNGGDGAGKEVLEFTAVVAP